MGNVESLIEKVRGRRDLGANIVYERAIEPVTAAWRPLPGNIHPSLTKRLLMMGIENVYSHQEEAIRFALDGNDVIIATPTASGKTFCYTIPVANALLNDSSATALFLFPLKALARDQVNSFNHLMEELPGAIKADVFDGDTTPHFRQKIIGGNPGVIFSNPDTLHASIMPAHAKWEMFFRNLKYVVIDETHTYRGVFGSHIAQVIRRLHRICGHYGSNPVFIASSATISQPGRFAGKLLGRKFYVVENSGAPRPGGEFIVYNTEASPFTDASKIIRAAVEEGCKSITFTKARKITELIYTWTVQAAPELAGRIGNYRAGFLPEERRKIEQSLFSGGMDAVISTSALEMGVDIGGLDVCILAGYPGTVVNTWQRAGRVGRRGDNRFLVLLIAMPDALDQYFVKRPEELFNRGFEEAVVDPENESALKGHIVCAAAELPLTEDDPYFTPHKRSPLMATLTAEKKIVFSMEGRWLSTRDRPSRFVSIRSVGQSYSIFLDGGKKVIGTLSGSRVFAEAHPGAVYLHNGAQYIVLNLDLEKRVVTVKPMDGRYYTRPRSEKETEVLSVIDEKLVNGHKVSLGGVKVTEQVTGYEKRAIFGRESLGVIDLQMPVTEFNTVGFWVEISESVKAEIDSTTGYFGGGIHAFEHAVISLFPLFALCDRNDIGGIAYPHHPALGRSAIFFYDGYQDGVGLCEAGYAKVEKLFRAALTLVSECDCSDGCPSCAHSPKCGSGNKPLDKKAAITVLEYLCGERKIPEWRDRPVSGKTPAKQQFASMEKIMIAEDIDFYDPAPDHRIVFFDLETQKSAAEVGGWNNVNKMLMAVGVVYDSREKRYIRYWEDDAGALIDKLHSADLVVGFNQIRFDYTVLSHYTSINLVEKIGSFDILVDVNERLGHRLSLNHLAKATLNMEKSADGLQSLVWWADGEREKVADYCEMDVKVTKELFEYGLGNGHLIYTHKKGEKVQIRLDWEIGELIRKAGKPKRKLRF